ncbi:MAG: tRNA pseudouridine(55) synthase TruB [Rhodobacteraceae bacterium]|nr:tRNA pseudouridine(55) synthase TruB [Paracoccaceae bacterium]
MARRKKGRDVSGWLVIDKPAGPTSTAVVNKIKYLFGAKKAGHAGTLDPAATGVLAVALGEATKTVPYITDALKCYEFTVRLGQATNTDDAEGEVTAQSDLRPTDDEIIAGLATFIGDVMQVPPAFSAVKINGERAYALARAGTDVELSARPLWVEELVLTDRPDADHVTLEMTCGKGGYVRAIARDLGQLLGCLGHVVTLRRVWSGPFDVENGTLMEALEGKSHAELDALLLPIETALGDLPQATCPAMSVARLRNGNPASVIATSAIEYGAECWASHDGQPIAIGRYMGGELHPSRVFVQPVTDPQ